MGAAIPEFRKPVMTLVEALWQDPSGAWQTSPARMEDKSAGGACIRVKTKIGVGAKLRIQWRFENFSGTAKYCRSEGREYLVGIQRDLAESPNPSRPVPAAVAPQKSPTSGDLADFNDRDSRHAAAATQQAECKSRSLTERRKLTNRARRHRRDHAACRCTGSQRSQGSANG